MANSSDMLMMVFRFDEDMARRFQRERCPCGGVRNIANFRRSPRGLPADISAEARVAMSVRFSFCCSDCRRRATPPSLRFHSRSWYLAPIRLLASVMDKGCRQAVRALGRAAGISSRTISRWRHWWNHTFRLSTEWRMLLGRLRPGAHEGHLPDTLFTYCRPIDGSEVWLTLLRVVAPYVDCELRFVRVEPWH